MRLLFGMASKIKRTHALSQNKTPIVVAISGGGRTLKNLIEKSSNYQVVGVISSSLKCKGNQIAKDNGLSLFVGDFVKQGNDLHQVLEGWLKSIDTQWIVLGGFLKKFPLLPSFDSKIINIHPALLPKFGGKGMYGHNVHKAVIKEKESESGATVHLLTQEYDKGQIIAQIKVKVKPTDDANSLASLVFDAECQILPLVVEQLIEGKLPQTSGFMEAYYDS